MSYLVAPTDGKTHQPYDYNILATWLTKINNYKIN